MDLKFPLRNVATTCKTAMLEIRENDKPEDAYSSLVKSFFTAEPPEVDLTAVRGYSAIGNIAESSQCNDDFQTRKKKRRGRQYY